VSALCGIAAPFVANGAVEGTEVAGPLRAHVSACLKCQARRAAMTRTARELTAMGDVGLKAPADLEWRVMASLEGDPAAKSWRAPVAVTAAVLSAAVLIWRRRPRAAG